MAHDQDCQSVYENCMWIPENKTKVGRECGGNINRYFGGLWQCEVMVCCEVVEEFAEGLDGGRHAVKLIYRLRCCRAFWFNLISWS